MTPTPPDPGPHASLERMNRFQEPEARRIIQDLALPAGSRGLDVVCGVGLWALWLAEALGSGGHVLGIEPEVEKVEAARVRAGSSAAAARLEFKAGDGTAVPRGTATCCTTWSTPSARSASAGA